MDQIPETLLVSLYRMTNSYFIAHAVLLVTSTPGLKDFLLSVLQSLILPHHLAFHTVVLEDVCLHDIRFQA